MTTSIIQPYLFFGGRCEEALAFYEKAIDAKIGVKMLHNENPQPPPKGTIAQGFENKIMHSSFTVGDSVIMASDGCDSGQVHDGFSLSITVPTEKDAERVFKALSEEGTVTMPLGETFWSKKFGMLKDRFGIAWMISIPVEAPKH